MHDPRVGRFFAVDPLAAKYPHNSPYAFSENRVIDGVELEGLEYVDANGKGVGPVDPLVAKQKGYVLHPEFQQEENEKNFELWDAYNKDLSKKGVDVQPQGGSITANDPMKVAESLDPVSAQLAQQPAVQAAAVGLLSAGGAMLDFGYQAFLSSYQVGDLSKVDGFDIASTYISSRLKFKGSSVLFNAAEAAVDVNTNGVYSLNGVVGDEKATSQFAGEFAINLACSAISNGISYGLRTNIKQTENSISYYRDKRLYYTNVMLSNSTSIEVQKKYNLVKLRQLSSSKTLDSYKSFSKNYEQYQDATGLIINRTAIMFTY